MTSEEQEFIRRFFRAVSDRPIEFNGQDDRRYVKIYEEPAFVDHDPVKLLASSITLLQGQSVQLLSGFRGSGKSTELHRLRQKLDRLGSYKVALLDIEDYLSPSQPIDVSDFLISVAGGMGDALLEAGHINGDPATEGYWMRLINFLVRTNIQLTDVTAGVSTPDKAASANFRVSLKSDPSFRQKLQERMAGHLGALARDVGLYVEDCVKKVKAKYGPDTEVVLLVDSMEHFRGALTNASAVQDSVVNLFAKHSDKLHFTYLHVVYTVPPYLKVLQPNLGSFYQPGGVQMIPTLKVRHRGGDRTPFQPALDLLEKLISERGDWKRLLGADARSTVDELSLLSGGHLRDFLRLFAEIIRRADRLPVPRSVVNAAIQQIRSEFLPIPDDDAVWLERIASSHTTALKNNDRLHDLARYFDSHLALSYRNGEDWYDVHPLVREVVQKQAADARERWGNKE